MQQRTRRLDAFITDEEGGMGGAIALTLCAIALGFVYARWRFGWGVGETWAHVSDAVHRMAVRQAATSDL